MIFNELQNSLEGRFSMIYTFWFVLNSVSGLFTIFYETNGI